MGLDEIKMENKVFIGEAKIMPSRNTLMGCVTPKPSESLSDVPLNAIEVKNRQLSGSTMLSRTTSRSHSQDPTDLEARAKAANVTSYVSVVVNIALSIVKAVAGYFGHSSALIGDAVHSLSDLISDFIVLLVTCFASRPADKDHPYGHGRMEMIGTLFIAIMLMVAAYLVFIESYNSLGETTEVAWYTLLAAAVSWIVKELLYRYTLHVGKKIDSKVVIANAYHHRTDALSSIIAVGGIGVAFFFKIYWADGVAGILVSLYILWVGLKTMYGAICSLSDMIPPEVEEKVKLTLSGIVEVEGYSDIRAREMGPLLILDLRIYVHPGTHVEDAEYIQQLVERSIKKSIPKVSEVIVRLTSNMTQTSNDPSHSLRTQLKDIIMSVEGVGEITQLRVFGPAPYAIDVHFTCKDSLTHCEEHRCVHQVRHAVMRMGDIHSVHVGLECDCSEGVCCESHACCHGLKGSGGVDGASPSVASPSVTSEIKPLETSGDDVMVFMKL